MKPSWIPVALATALLGLSAGGCAQCDCDPDREVRAFAGPSAENCGFAPRGTSREHVLECAFSALVRGRPVHAGWGGSGVDPDARTYIVRTESRGTFMVTYAVDEAGEGGACAQLIADGCNG